MLFVLEYQKNNGQNGKCFINQHRQKLMVVSGLAVIHLKHVLSHYTLIFMPSSYKLKHVGFQPNPKCCHCTLLQTTHMLKLRI